MRVWQLPGGGWGMKNEGVRYEGMRQYASRIMNQLRCFYERNHFCFW